MVGQTGVIDTACMPEDILRADMPFREAKGRGLALFGCPPGFRMPFLETLPGTLTLSPEGQTPASDMPARILLNIPNDRSADLNRMVNRILLPAWRARIPVYALLPWDIAFFNGGSVTLQSDMDALMTPLWREQWRFLLGSACVCASTDAFFNSAPPHSTPLERFLASGLRHAGLDFVHHYRAGPHEIDFLLTAPDGRRIAVETDGQDFVHEADTLRDAALRRDFHMDDTLRFNGSRIVHNRSACVALIRERLAVPCAASSFIPEPLPDLSPEQQACLSPRSGPTLTLAPAGSGKTRVLTRRVVEAVRGGTPPERILCVVFNREARMVMSERIHKTAGLPGVRIATLHSLGYEICRKAPGSPYAEFQVVTAATLPGGLRRLIRQALREDIARHEGALHKNRIFPEHLVSVYEETFSMSKRTLRPLHRRTGDQADGFDADQAGRIRRVVEEALRSRKLMTYDDQIFRAVEVLLACPQARRFCQSLFDMTLVDEVQDLTPIQFLMTRILALPQNNLFAVGDDDQMINSFTGADPSNIRSFSLMYPGAVIHTLGENHRCAPDIVRCSGHVITYNRRRFEKPIRPAKTEESGSGKAVSVISCPGIEAEAEAAASVIKQWFREGYAPSDIAVLVRVKSIASLAQMALKKAGVRFRPLDEAHLYTSVVGKTLGAYLTICVRPQDAAPRDYVLALANPSRRLTNAHFRLIAVHGRALIERLYTLPAYPRSVLSGFHETTRQLNRMTGSGIGASRFLQTLIDRFSLIDAFRRRQKMSRVQGAASLEDLLEVFFDLADTCSTVETFLYRFFQNMKEEQEAKQDDDRGGERIVITTIHRSKGDEYRCALLFHVAENTLPHRRMTAAPEHIEEERRVFYVGITRAVERLCVTTEKKRRSRFLAEMDRPYRDRPKRSLWRWVGVIRAGS